MLSAHLRTITGHLQRSLSPLAQHPSETVRIPIHDPKLGALEINGELERTGQATALVVLLHGMGGHAASPYLRMAAHAARQQGLASLRLNMRGADGSGEDYYHANLTEDLPRVFAHPALADYQAIYLCGFSLGGHIALAAGVRQPLPRLSALAAICPPLALAGAARGLDDPSRALYRWRLLRDLKRHYRAVSLRRTVPIAADEADAITRIVAWDHRVIAPRLGFADADDYYARASVAKDIGRIAVPTLVLQANNDPMVPSALTEELTRNAPSITTVSVAKSGHLAFPATLDLGMNAPLGVYPQVMRWLQQVSGNADTSAAAPGFVSPRASPLC